MTSPAEGYIPPSTPVDAEPEIMPPVFTVTGIGSEHTTASTPIVEEPQHHDLEARITFPGGGKRAQVIIDGHPDELGPMAAAVSEGLRYLSERRDVAAQSGARLLMPGRGTEQPQEAAAGDGLTAGQTEAIVLTKAAKPEAAADTTESPEPKSDEATAAETAQTDAATRQRARLVRAAAELVGDKFIRRPIAHRMTRQTKPDTKKADRQTSSVDVAHTSVETELEKIKNLLNDKHGKTTKGKRLRLKDMSHPQRLVYAGIAAAAFFVPNTIYSVGTGHSLVDLGAGIHAFDAPINDAKHAGHVFCEIPFVGRICP